jgi:drebrin-like protein
LRKGTCAKHIYDVGLLLKGAHLTINASNEDDVDEDRIMKKLASVTPKYNFKENKISTMDEKREPVGTNYQKKVIAKEINASERDAFWRKEEEEERKRQAAEAEHKRTETAKGEAERLKREAEANKPDAGVR